VPAKDVSIQQFLGYSLLSGIDDFVTFGGRLNLLKMTRLNGIAENDSHIPKKDHSWKWPRQRLGGMPPYQGRSNSFR
jgi:hypothetical protein